MAFDMSLWIQLEVRNLLEDFLDCKMLAFLQGVGAWQTVLGS